GSIENGQSIARPARQGRGDGAAHAQLAGQRVGVEAALHGVQDADRLVAQFVSEVELGQVEPRGVAVPALGGGCCSLQLFQSRIELAGAGRCEASEIDEAGPWYFASCSRADPRPLTGRNG